VQIAQCGSDGAPSNEKKSSVSSWLQIPPDEPSGPKRPPALGEAESVGSTSEGLGATSEVVRSTSGAVAHGASGRDGAGGTARHGGGGAAGEAEKEKEGAKEKEEEKKNMRTDSNGDNNRTNADDLADTNVHESEYAVDEANVPMPTWSLPEAKLDWPSSDYVPKLSEDGDAEEEPPSKESPELPREESQQQEGSPEEYSSDKEYPEDDGDQHEARRDYRQEPYHYGAPWDPYPYENFGPGPPPGTFMPTGPGYMPWGPCPMPMNMGPGVRWLGGGAASEREHFYRVSGYNEPEYPDRVEVPTIKCWYVRENPKGLGKEKMVDFCTRCCRPRCEHWRMNRCNVSRCKFCHVDKYCHEPKRKVFPKSEEQRGAKQTEIRQKQLMWQHAHQQQQEYAFNLQAQAAAATAAATWMGQAMPYRDPGPYGHMQ